MTYAFDTLDERPVSSAVHRGKPTILALVTAGDIVGQAQVDYLVAMARVSEFSVKKQPSFPVWLSPDECRLYLEGGLGLSAQTVVATRPH